MAEGTLYEHLRPTGVGFLHQGWLTSTYTNIDDNVTNPTVSGTGDYTEGTYTNGDDNEWEGYTITAATQAYWWNRIAKLEVNVLYYLFGTIKTNPRFNVAWVHSGTREGWSPYSATPLFGKAMSSVTKNAWTWTTVTFYPNEATKPNDPTDWTWEEWIRDNTGQLQVETQCPDFKDAGSYYRIAVLYVDLYVWPTTHGGA